MAVWAKLKLILGKIQGIVLYCILTYTIKYQDTQQSVIWGYAHACTLDTFTIGDPNIGPH